MKRFDFQCSALRAMVCAPVVCGILAVGVLEARASDSPVSFSVNGPVDPNFDGLPVPGSPLYPPLPPIRLGPTPAATGLFTGMPGDVAEYFLFGVASEAEIFQSEPDLGPAGPPAGTNNQILQAISMGLLFGASNVNALTFGEDFFNGDEIPVDGGAVVSVQWLDRGALFGFIEPTVIISGLPIDFFFSVDPWAIGTPGTDVELEATDFLILTLPVGPPGSADEHLPGGPPFGVGPWSSEGHAAGDVFSADPISAPGTNIIDHPEFDLGLAGALPPMEDDLDALEHVGDNTAFGLPAEPGNTHDRVDPTAGFLGGVHPPDLGDPLNPNHDVNNGNPIIFSVDRGSVGDFGSAVKAQVLSPIEGASGDLFIAVILPDGPFIGTPTNMLLIDEGQLGLSHQDDLDAVIVQILLPPGELETRIALASFGFDPVFESAGLGFTEPLLTAGEAVVGFSVDTSSFGLVGSAVDFETRVDGLGLLAFGGSGIMEQAGDVFFSDLIPPLLQTAVDPGTTLLYSTNYLWFEEVDLGLDPGTWSFIPPGPIPPSDLGELPDELNALDSLGIPIVSCTTDLDGDGDVDASDFLTFSVCFNGSLLPPKPGCANPSADIDGDGDVDASDFLTFSTCFNGSLKPPTPLCPCP